MKNLKAIGKKFKTDKVNENINYTVSYEKYFEMLRKKELKILEIGVKEGAGLLTWNEYFPNSNIVGMDNWLKVKDSNRVINKMSSQNIKIFVGDQSSTSDLSELIKLHGKFDIIIDDGGHTMMQQQKTFGFLFKHLNKGGIYVIEDLVTSYWGYGNDRHKDFCRTTPKEEKITTLEFLKKLQKERKSISSFLSESQNKYIETNLNHCEVFSKTATYRHNHKNYNAGIGFIRKHGKL